MTRTLILMRHAKSSWDQPGLDDHSRPLNPRGQRSATALGDWLREKGWLPDQVLCSSAKRTRQTLAGLNLDAPVQYSDTLYRAGAGQMLRILSQAEGETVLMLGHNPGIADFAAGILTEPPEHPRFSDYPTGATLVARLDIPDWDKVAWKSGEVLDFTVPRDLPGM